MGIEIGIKALKRARSKHRCCYEFYMVIISNLVVF